MKIRELVYDNYKNIKLVISNDIVLEGLSIYVKNMMLIVDILPNTLYLGNHTTKSPVVTEGIIYPCKQVVDFFVNTDNNFVLEFDLFENTEKLYTCQLESTYNLNLFRYDKSSLQFKIFYNIDENGLLQISAENNSEELKYTKVMIKYVEK